MSQTTTVITFESILPELVARDLEVIEQKSFYKIPGPGKSIYISRTKRSVTRVDISGFEVKHPAVSPPPKKNGKVTGQVQMSHEGAWDAIMTALDLLQDRTLVGTKQDVHTKVEEVKTQAA